MRDAGGPRPGGKSFGATTGSWWQISDAVEILLRIYSAAGEIPNAAWVFVEVVLTRRKWCPRARRQASLGDKAPEGRLIPM